MFFFLTLLLIISSAAFVPKNLLYQFSPPKMKNSTHITSFPENLFVTTALGQIILDTDSLKNRMVLAENQTIEMNDQINTLKQCLHVIEIRIEALEIRFDVLETQLESLVKINIFEVFLKKIIQPKKNQSKTIQPKFTQPKIIPTFPTDCALIPRNEVERISNKMK